MIGNDAKVTIISDGDPFNTKILDLDGNMINGITNVTWTINMEGSKLLLEFTDMPMKVEITDVCLIKMRKWFKTIYVHPAYFGHFFSKGYKVIK